MGSAVGTTHTIAATTTLRTPACFIVLLPPEGERRYGAEGFRHAMVVLLNFADDRPPRAGVVVRHVGDGLLPRLAREGGVHRLLAVEGHRDDPERVGRRPVEVRQRATPLEGA